MLTSVFLLPLFQ